MNPIRPNVFPTQTPAPAGAGGQAADAARAAAQKAFFDAAMGRTAAPAAPQATTQAAAAATAPAPQAQLRPAAAPQDPPGRILRPGSLLDIRV